MKPMNTTSSLSKREKMRRNLVARLVHLAVVLPEFEPGLGRWHHGDEAQVERQLTRLVARVRAVQGAGSVARGIT